MSSGVEDGGRRYRLYRTAERRGHCRDRLQRHPDRRRRGYATEAALALVDWALRQPGGSSVVAGCDNENVPSIRTLERIGFVCSGESDGQLRWRLETADPNG
ncbi:MAG: GNAT family N-acetyltransferase [Actinobacteria bacterium]|nr:GNAT family N-acetyltransferase [Actinomycetota bacterium]